MARETKRRSNGRRSPWAAAALIGIGLLITGGVYAGASAAMAASTDTSVASALTVEDGKKLFQANCATCHGLDLQGSDDGPVAVRRRRARGRVPGRAPAACRCRPAGAAGAAEAGAVHRGADPRDGGLRAVDGSRPDLPRRGDPRRRGRRGPRSRAVPRQLRDVPQRRRRRRRAHRGQVRAGARQTRARCTCTPRWSPARRTCRSSTT